MPTRLWALPGPHTVLVQNSALESPPCPCCGCAPAAVSVGGAAASGPTEGRSSPRACVSFQAPTVTIEGFLQALSLAVDKQFEERKKLLSCV